MKIKIHPPVLKCARSLLNTRAEEWRSADNLSNFESSANLSGNLPVLLGQRAFEDFFIA